MPSKSCCRFRKNYLFHSLWEVPFGIPQYVQYFLHELTSILLCVPFILADIERCWFGGTHYGFPCATEIVHIFQWLLLLQSCFFFLKSPWFVLLCNGFNLVDNEAVRFNNSYNVIVLLGWLLVTRSDKIGLTTHLKATVLKIRCVVTFQWLKLHLPDFHTFCTNSLPLKPSTVQESSYQVSCHLLFYSVLTVSGNLQHGWVAGAWGGPSCGPHKS